MAESIDVVVEVEPHVVEENIGNTSMNYAVDIVPSPVDIMQHKLSHRKWRSKIKQMKRKAHRQMEAQQRDALAKATDCDNEINTEVQDECQKKFDVWAEQERQYQHKLWLQREINAQAAFLAKKDRQEKERIRREEEEKKIKEEWEERQKQEKEEEEERKKIEADKKSRQDELLKEATSNERKDEGAWRLPEAPAGYSTDRPICPFFSKVGVCRFGDRCSRMHDVPEDSCTLLFPGMYANFELEQSMRDEYDTDLTLEFEDSELYQHFEMFYGDVLPEFKAVGHVVQLKVCCNYEPHLRGNVYVQYSRREEALEAFAKFNGRWYAGRQLSCWFSCVSRWKMAICGLYHQRRCPKGRHCNFLHVFRNPGDEFRNADMLISRMLVNHVSEHRHSQSRDRTSHRDSMRRSVRQSHSRSSSRRSHGSHHQSPRKSRHRSRTRSRSRSDSTDRKHRRSHGSSHRRSVSSTHKRSPDVEMSDKHHYHKKKKAKCKSSTSRQRDLTPASSDTCTSAETSSQQPAVSAHEQRRVTLSPQSSIV